MIVTLLGVKILTIQGFLAYFFRWQCFCITNEVFSKVHFSVNLLTNKRG